MGLDECRVIQFPKITDQRGNLTFIEEDRHVPFPVKRVFYIYDIPSGTDRGAHAHKTLHQVLICLSGGLEVHLDDGREQRTEHLNRPWLGLYIPPMVWASEGNFDPGTVYLVLTSDYYNEADYYRDYEQFLQAVRMGIERSDGASEGER
jgi:dTDP-4-dehydrorhamnose 3,5-epimerase-like enzyme